MTPVDLVVLAGGAGRRMGRDKALLELDGELLVHRVVRRLRPLGGAVLLARGDMPRVPGPWEGGAVPEVLPDARGAAGPVAGLLAGLEAAGTDVVAVVAVDHADADARVLAAAARALRSAPDDLDLVLPAGRAWLHAAWARAAAPAVRRVVEGADRPGVAVREVVAALRVHVHEPGGPAPWQHDLDTPDDLAARG